jgi:hypothetical protein
VISGPFTPPPGWTTCDAAAWAREFVTHAQADPRLATDWGAMTMWFSQAILAGMGHERAPDTL